MRGLLFWPSGAKREEEAKRQGSATLPLLIDNSTRVAAWEAAAGCGVPHGSKRVQADVIIFVGKRSSVVDPIDQCSVE